MKFILSLFTIILSTMICSCCGSFTNDDSSNYIDSIIILNENYTDSIEIIGIYSSDFC